MAISGDTLTLIVPVFNEEEAVPRFLEEISAKLAGLDAALEILFIDDGSKDRTFEVIREAAAKDARVRYIKLSRNFGKEIALTAGLELARGDAVVPMDVDLQDPPELILEFVRLWRQGYKTVYGARRRRDTDSFMKRMTAGGFYRVFNAVADMRIPEDAGDFRLIDREVVEVIRQLPERTRFMKGLFSWAGFSTIGVPYDRPAREVGTTSFNYRKLFRFAMDGITSFSTLPLRVWSAFGAVMALASLGYMLIVVVRTLVFGVDWPGYASLMSAVLFFGSVQLISVGVLGEYIGRIYFETKRRPLYVVETSNIGASAIRAADPSGSGRTAA
ncbi:glycosyltransferase family 2 protein [Paragemmobacter straminiformis]|uniref:Glycosyltransferase family 2 protein n=1 Tax=Paragemmobacter straminiformis TaxID=2045119 RepID=A0A842I8T4_9RHOB|nr:glycosyltransferase family 2 protein [Gemmobacter straminiformis]MBC2835991.1 glycosyltransferase family 2 protein [Gemmobacter straminiformis]